MYYLEIEDKNGVRYKTTIPIKINNDYIAKKWAKNCLERIENNNYKEARILKEIIKYKNIKEV